jgi:outer membrane protein TolC
VLATIQAYWQARAASDQVDVLRLSLDLQGQLADRVRTQIAAGQRTAGDGARSSAAVADVRARYEAAQRQLIDTRINLAQTMGVALADALSIPLATDPYAQPPVGLQIDPQAYATFAREAVARRFDRQAALKAEASGKALVEGARRDTRPFVDATVSGWGTSVKESSFGYSNWVFRSGSLALSYDKPLGNNTAAGTLDARRAALRQTEIDSADLERIITLNVIQLTESLRLAAQRLRSAEEARNSYDETIQSEQARFTAGTASLFDTILTEQQATAARLAYIAARQEYATILATLRHEAGLLVQDGKVEGAQLVSVPPVLIRK